MATSRTACIHLIVVLTILLTGGRAGAAQLCGVTFGTSQNAVLYDVNAATGAAGNPRPVGVGHLVGIAWSPSGSLYGLTNSTAPTSPNSLVQIDPTTGASQVIGSTGLTSIIEGDLARDPTTGQLYGCYNLITGKRQLFTVNPQTGAASIIPGSLSGDPSALAFAPNGTFYGIDTSLGELLTIDKVDGVVLSYKTLSTGLGSTAGMAIDPFSGVIYVADGESGGTDKLYTLNPSTGVLTAVGSLGLTDGLAGLAFVPEPTAAMLLGLAAGLAVMGRRGGRGVA